MAGSQVLQAAGVIEHLRQAFDLSLRAADVLGSAARGELDVAIDRELPLAEAAEAHRLLEGRKTSGKLLLIP